MTAPDGGLAAAVAALALRVNRDTVLHARAALLAEADRLDRELRRSATAISAESASAAEIRYRRKRLWPSTNASELSISHCLAYNRDLRASAAALDATARAYGYSDDEIAASFRRVHDPKAACSSSLIADGLRCMLNRR